jgi:hypothetical protein
LAALVKALGISGSSIAEQHGATRAEKPPPLPGSPAPA